MRHTPTDGAQQRRKRIDRIHEHLDDVVGIVTGPELQDEILDWMDAVEELPASSVLSRVEHRLAEIETEYPMHAVDVDGESYFPDDCADCEHYGVSCPVLTKPEEETERERLRSDLADAPEETVKREMRRYAGRVGCDVILSVINDWEDDSERLLQKGLDLRRRTIHILRPADDHDRADAELDDVLADGGGR
jgi:hypothetical protein